MENDGVEYLIHITVVTSQNGWTDVWKKSRETRGMALCGDNLLVGLRGAARAADRQSWWDHERRRLVGLL